MDNQSKEQNQHNQEDYDPNEDPRLVAAFLAGYLPRPEVLKEYEAIVEGSADRILTIAEEQVRHRISEEKIITKARIQDDRLIKIFTFITVMVMMVGGGFLIYWNKQIPLAWFLILTPPVGAGVDFFRKGSSNTVRKK